MNAGATPKDEPALEALERVERERLRLLEDLWRRGAPIPEPRPPLRRRL